MFSLLFYTPPALPVLSMSVFTYAVSAQSHSTVLSGHPLRAAPPGALSPGQWHPPSQALVAQSHELAWHD
jgi:hypothetical protein